MGGTPLRLWLAGAPFGGARVADCPKLLTLFGALGPGRVCRAGRGSSPARAGRSGTAHRDHRRTGAADAPGSLWRRESPMLNGSRGPRPSEARRSEMFVPKGERLEERALLVATTLDLVGLAPPNLPNIAINTTPNATGIVSTTTPPPSGILEAGGVAGQGAGASVTDVGDTNNDGFDDFLVGAPTVVSSGGVPVFGGGGNSSVYLIYGSTGVTASGLQTFNWLSLDATVSNT